MDISKIKNSHIVSAPKPNYLSAVLAVASLSALTMLAAGQWPAQAAPPAVKAVSAASNPRAQSVEAALKRLLNSKVTSPGGKLNLKVQGNSRTANGYFTNILVGGRPAQVRKLRISELTLNATDVRIDVNALLNQNELRTLSSKTKLRAVISQDDLTLLLSKGKHTKQMGLRVTYIGDKMHVTGNFHWGWFNGPVMGDGKLRLAPGHKVFFDIISLKLNGNEVPAWLKTKFSERINPVIDYEDIPFRPVFKSLTFKGPVAILTA